MVGPNFGVQGGPTEDVGLRLLKEKQAIKVILLRPGQQMEFWANFILWDFHWGLKPVISKEIKRKKTELFRFKEMFSPIITCSNSRCSSSDFYFRWVQPQCSCGEVTLSLSLLTSWCGWGDAAPFPRCTSTLALPKVFQGPPLPTGLRPSSLVSKVLGAFL